VAIFVTGMIAVITVGWQSSRAALANPVKSLRTE
ncbi:MAG: cell division protein FtsX, partial [Arcicella sp.]|nr:cell division protein FtsX [Arcicella sp.]